MSPSSSTSKSNQADLDLTFIGSKDEAAETRSVTSRSRLRSQLDAEVAEFLARGGKINEIDPDVMADPPRKPENNYGSRSI